MPLIDLICSCGHRYEGLLSFSTVDPDLDRCPACGGAPQRAPAVGVFHREREAADFEAPELEEHLEAKAHYESNEVSRRILSGEITLRERGPKFLRPVCPEHLKTKWF